MRAPFVKEPQRVPLAGLLADGTSSRQNMDDGTVPENLSTNRNRKLTPEQPYQLWEVPRRSTRPGSSPWRKSHHGPSFHATATPTGERLPTEASGTVKMDQRPEALGTTNPAGILSSAAIPANRERCQCRWPTKGARRPATSHAATARAASFWPRAGPLPPCGHDPTERPAIPGCWRHAMPFRLEQSTTAASRCFPRPVTATPLPPDAGWPDRPSGPPEAATRVVRIRPCPTKRFDPLPNHP